MGVVRIGCSGWDYRAWRDGFYPRGMPAARWLEYYATVFDTVEVNSTFYRPARREAVQRWMQQTPPGFVFAIKASRYLTHAKRLAMMDAGVAELIEPLEPLVQAGRLGPVLWQLPASFQRDDARLEQALSALPDGRHAFEFRHESWFARDVYRLLRSRGVALVIADRPGLDFQTQELTADFTYVRFHEGTRGQRGNYSPGELAAWAQRIAEWARSVDVHAYFNNDWEGFAPRNALLLRELLATPAGRPGPRPAGAT